MSMPNETDVKTEFRLDAYHAAYDMRWYHHMGGVYKEIPLCKTASMLKQLEEQHKTELTKTQKYYFHGVYAMLDALETPEKFDDLSDKIQIKMYICCDKLSHVLYDMNVMTDLAKTLDRLAEWGLGFFDDDVYY